MIDMKTPQWFDIKKISLLTGLTLKEIKEGLLRLRKYGILNVGYDGQNKLSSVRLIEFSDYMKDNLPVIGPKLSKDSTTNEVILMQILLNIVKILQWSYLVKRSKNGPIKSL